MDRSLPQADAGGEEAGASRPLVRTLLGALDAALECFDDDRCAAPGRCPMSQHDCLLALLHQPCACSKSLQPFGS